MSPPAGPPHDDPQDQRTAPPAGSRWACTKNPASARSSRNTASVREGDRRRRTTAAPPPSSGSGLHAGWPSGRRPRGRRSAAPPTRPNWSPAPGPRTGSGGRRRRPPPPTRVPPRGSFCKHFRQTASRARGADGVAGPAGAAGRRRSPRRSTPSGPAAAVFRVRLGGEGGPAGQQVIEHRPQPVHVRRAPRPAGPGGLLRGHVARRAEDLPGAGGRGVQRFRRRRSPPRTAWRRPKGRRRPVWRGRSPSPRATRFPSGRTAAAVAIGRRGWRGVGGRRGRRRGPAARSRASDPGAARRGRARELTASATSARIRAASRGGSGAPAAVGVQVRPG